VLRVVLQPTHVRGEIKRNMHYHYSSVREQVQVIPYNLLHNPELGKSSTI
jgi:hypothetical protein